MTNDEFATELRKFHETMSVKQIASICGASLPTVERWLAGKSAPVKQLREILLKEIKEKQKKD